MPLPWSCPIATAFLPVLRHRGVEPKHPLISYMAPRAELCVTLEVVVRMKLKHVQSALVGPRVLFHEAAPLSDGAVDLIYQSGTKDIVESSLVYLGSDVRRPHFFPTCAFH